MVISLILSFFFYHRRSRRRQRRRHVRNIDRDETPTGQRTSSSEADKPPVRSLLNKVLESTEEIDGNHPVISCNTSSSGIVEPDDITSKTTISDVSSNPSQVSQDLSDVNICFCFNERQKRSFFFFDFQSSKQQKSLRSRKSDAPVRIFLQVVDVPNNASDDTAEPDSPLSGPELSISQNHPSPMPVLQPKITHADEPSTMCGMENSIFSPPKELNVLHVHIHLVVQIISDQSFLSLIKPLIIIVC